MSPRSTRCLLSLVGMLVLCCRPSCVTGDESPVVSGYDRFHAVSGPSAEAGELLLAELNCVACHADRAPARGGSSAPKRAPVLDELTRRVQPRYLARFIADPHGTKPGTTMPDLLAGMSVEQRKEQAEAMAHYLASLGSGVPEQQFPTIGAADIGRRLFHQVGCAACHGSRLEGATSLPGDKPLGDLSSKYTLPSLTAFLRDPLHVRPSGRMPDLNLNSAEATLIASYLLKGLPEVARLRYSYYEGSWDKLPEFSEMTPVTTAALERIDVSKRRRGDRFGLRFEAFMRVERDGRYRFHLGSDDGSRLTIDGRVVIDNDGIHAYTQKSGDAELTAGFHAVVVDYFEQGGEERLTLEYEGPGVKRQPVDRALSHAREQPEFEDLSMDVDPRKAAAGGQLFASLGCAACHQLHEGDRRVESSLRVAGLGEVDSSRGCLGDPVSGAAPDYRLTGPQRRSLVAALATRAGEAGEIDPERVVQRTLTTFNCYACHGRNDVGGIDDARNDLFAGTIPEMGDEGRIPPPLTGVGGKLTAPWLAAVLAEGADDRPYMLTRMPKFGADNVGHLQSLLTELDRLEPLPEVDFDESLDVVKRQGRRMVGSKGFSCIKCHTFGQYRATGIQSIDMKSMSKRLTETWFRRYVRRPQQFRPGTRMPEAWPSERSFLDDMLDGSSQEQIAAVWAYLSDGQRTPIPQGLVTNSMELIPIEDAVIYRNFIEGAGPRAIGVGYPEGVNLAFDANDLRLAMLWEGRFIDASLHWNGRGQGFQPPLGENVLKLAEGVTFARLGDADADWPRASARELSDYRFRGYRLTPDRRPTFRYSIGDVQCEDFVEARGGAESGRVRRILRLSSPEPPSDLWMRAAVGNSISRQTDGSFAVDDRSRVRIVASSSPVLREKKGKMELLVPILFRDGGAEVEQSYSW